MPKKQTFKQKVRSVALVLLAAVVSTAGLLPHSAAALSGSDFKAGRIIDNSVFYNRNAMGLQDIQNWLNNRVPNCDTWGTKTSEYGGGTRAQYGTSKGLPPPYTCVKDYWQNPDTGEDNYGGKATPAGAKSAAQIIYDSAQQYGVNPQVLLVLIQKEAIGNILGDEWPWPNQYKTVTGYGCPDSTGCDSKYYGFANQVRLAARQFNLYATNPNAYNFVPGTTSYVLWSPNQACGGGAVYIENQATASLYNYTPYQPNQAALNNLYGTGDGCSAYGNRNFWRIFNEWFGRTIERPEGMLLEDAKRQVKTVTYNGRIYAFYYDAFQRVLRMATQNSTSGQWEFSVLDGIASGGGRINASLGNDVTVTQLGNTLQLFYYDETNGNLRHAWLDGSTWNFENLDGDPGSLGKLHNDLGSNPTVLVAHGQLQLFYHDNTTQNLRHAWTNETGWHFENLDGDRGAISGYTSNVGQISTATMLYDGIQLFYYDQGLGNLRHAWTDSRGWHFENLDGDPYSIGRRDSDLGVAMSVVNFNNQIQLFYHDRAFGQLRHAWTDATGWHFEHLDGDGKSLGGYDGRLGLNVSAMQYDQSLQVFYYDVSRGNLRHAWTSATGWNFENMDGDPGSLSRRESTTGLNPSVTQFGNSIQMYYYDRTRGKLRHAWADANGWHFEDLGSTVIY